MQIYISTNLCPKRPCAIGHSSEPHLDVDENLTVLFSFSTQKGTEI